MSRIWLPLGAVLAMIVVLAPGAAVDRKPPRIVAAVMLDADGDSRADRVRLTYSEPVRHRLDADGRYPFAVSGYRIRSVGKAAGKTLAVLLVEQAQPDPDAAPALRYRRTSAQPVRDRAGNQAVAQRFARTKAHGRAPPPPTPTDADGDGTPDADDCAPRNASIHPKAADLPDLGFVDSNCDGIDGTERDAIFASPTGNDANPGTKARPKRELQAALATIRAGNGRYVLVAFGTYARVTLASGIGIFGGYDPSSWTRRDRFPDGLPLVSGSPEGVLADGAKDVVLQHLRIRGLNPGASERSAYGIRALGNSSLTLERVAVSAGDGAAGPAGAGGSPGQRAGNGDPGAAGSCDGDVSTPGANGGSSPAGRTGGRGGGSGFLGGNPGSGGKVGTAGGAAGDRGNPGKPGGKGESGENGAPGAAGAGAVSSTGDAREAWAGTRGGAGGTGEPGNGGGGGGGGGPQVGTFVNNGGGNGGGGGGGGGSSGTGGRGGSFGGGSFGVYLLNSRIVIESSSVAAGNGGAGGRGGDGGLGGAGGAGGKGGRICTSEVGAGGDGGFGGAGGRGGGGGGGAGGPSIGIFKGGTSTVTLRGSSKSASGTPGAGGVGGRSGPGGVGGAGASGIAKPIHP